MIEHRSIKSRRIRIDSITLEAHIAYPISVWIVHQAVKPLTTTADKLGHKIISHERATKRALAFWGASSKAKPPTAQGARSKRA